MSDETWDAVCNSLKTHPTLQILNLPASQSFRGASLASAVLKSRIQVLLDMMKVNMTIHTIRVSGRYDEHELSEGRSLRTRILEIQKTRPITYHVKVLGRAIVATRVRTDANSLWMILSGNLEVALSPTTAATTPCTNHPTPATATVS
jgi:hypothetical protein